MFFCKSKLKYHAYHFASVDIIFLCFVYNIYLLETHDKYINIESMKKRKDLVYNLKCNFENIRIKENSIIIKNLIDTLYIALFDDFLLLL